MKKQVLFVLILCLVFICIVTACTKSDGDTDDSTAPSPETVMYTVTFKTNGGSSVASVRVQKGERITAPTQPTRTQYIFSGWYKDSSFTNVWDFDSDIVNSDVTLYAKWKPSEVCINSVNNATIVGTDITMILDDENINEIDMNNKVVLNDSKFTWKLYYDVLGQMEIPTKLATTKEGTLENGSNIFYIVVTNENGTKTKSYTLDIYKKYEVTVKVYGINDHVLDTFTAITLDTMPTPAVSLDGYTISDWISTDAKPGEKISKDAPLIISLTALCNPNSYNVSFSANGGSIETDTQNVEYASAVKLPVPEKTGYSFIGWYFGSECISDKNGNCIWSIAKNVNLKAVYRANRYSVTVQSDNSEAGSVTATGSADSVQLMFDVNGREDVAAPDYQIITSQNKMTEPSALSLNGYLFKGWYDSADCNNRFDFTQNLIHDTTVYADWYKLPGNNQAGYYTMYQNGGEVSVVTDENVQYIYFMPTTMGEYEFYYKNSASSSSRAARIRIYDATNSKCIKDSTAVSSTSYEKFTFDATVGNIYYVSVDKYSASSTLTCYLTTEKPEEYGKFDNPDDVATSEYGRNVTMTARSNNGYVFVGWYDGETKLSDELSCSISVSADNKVYVAKWIQDPITLEANMSQAGTISKEGGAIVGKDVTVTAKTNVGYTFVGWYDGEAKLSDELSYTFTTPMESKTYTAKWCKVSIKKNIDEAGSINSLDSVYFVGEEVTVIATKNIGYVFVGWYDGETKLTDELSYTFTMPAENKLYTATYVLCVEHALDEKCVCTLCGAEIHNGYSRFGDVIYFGTYPKSEVTDSTLKSTLTELAGTLPTSSWSANWREYSYRASGNSKSFMWYIDVTNEGEKYRGVYFTSYRPFNLEYSSSESNSYQDDNGYYTYKVYWFKYEPIKWQIIDNSDGKAFLFADIALDSQAYHSLSNNYANSTIREWLNGTFYNVAFNDIQKELIQTTTVVNSSWSTGFSSNPYACSNTSDKVFLLSYREAESLTSDKARTRKSTDYAKSQGCRQASASIYGNGAAGNSLWWLRSPYNDQKTHTRGLSTYGDTYYSVTFEITGTYYGVVPALWITL